MDGRKAAIFDFDGTLIAGDSIVRFIRYAVRRGHLSPLALVGQALNAWRGVRGRITPEEGKSRALAFLSGMDATRQESFCREFCRDELMPNLYPQGLERLQAHADAGDAVLLVSASPDIYMRHLAQLLPVEAVLATPTDSHGRVTRNNRDGEKVQRVLAWAAQQPYNIDWQASCAYGDSAHDLPVMRLTGHPVMINPKPAMRRIGQGLPEENWGK